MEPAEWPATRRQQETPPGSSDAVVSLAKRRGFVFPSSEIYGGTRSAWDYGPLGVELKENVRRQWWQSMVQSRDDVVGLDSAVILAARGVGGVRPRRRVRRPADRVPVLPQAVPRRPPRGGVRGQARADPAASPGRGHLPELRHPRRSAPSRGLFNGLLKTYLGPVEDEEALHYLRPETAQGIFVNFLNVMTAAREEAAVRHRADRQVASATRSRRATSSSAPASSSRWRWSSSSSRAPTRSGTSTGSSSAGTGTSTSGIAADNLRYFEHPKEKLSHYSKRTVDIEYRFRFGGTEFAELEGIANRTDFDLTTHAEHSGADLTYFDQEKSERWTPYVIEPAAGLDPRACWPSCSTRYAEDEAPNAKGGVEKRTVLRLDPRLAPVKVAVLPLSRNADLSPKARDLAERCAQRWNVEFDDAGRSAAATAARTRSVRRSASRSTSTPSTTTR